MLQFNIREHSSSLKNLQLRKITKKPTTFNNIPAKILVENYDICAQFISKNLMTL